ncbi:fimbrial protein [Paraburkholderia silviterrae]|uniref:Fimbrial protein n=1 Tax=Paraburkholderia silviterrae TaxID=2528715 RepID=A0A4R5MDT4_9BURK|nr:fimbrial protein [Paraburkholderia silviterrae]TDG25275.1 fimbrial protein [Paraburkholderia silviterrae]
MNARAQVSTERTVADSFVFASANDAHARWVAHTLGPVGKVETVVLDPALVAQQISQNMPSLLLVDFSGSGNAQGGSRRAGLAQGSAASAVAAAAHAAFPGLQIIAVGTLAEPESAISALRAGVRDFVDAGADSEDALRIVRQVLENRVEPVSRHGRLTVLLGARPGMGVTTLAAGLGVLLAQKGAALNRHAALLDLGLPAGDGALLLNAGNGFSFVDAVRNLRRFDQTFVHTALARHESGLALTTLPADLGALREVSYQSAVALLTRLRAFFDQQVVDLGGFSNAEFVFEVAHAADQAWLVCDQSVASIVAASRQLELLRDGGIENTSLRLVINQYEAGIDLSAAQIAERLAIELAGVLPARRVALCQAANRGQLLVQSAPRDPYVRALDALAAQLDGMRTPVPKKFDALRRPLRGLFQHSSKRS